MIVIENLISYLCMLVRKSLLLSIIGGQSNL